MTPPKQNVVQIKQEDDMIKMENAENVFGLKSTSLNFEVPVFQGSHPYVPKIDPDYQFKPETLVPVLWGLVNNKKTWLDGHTGTGKSTLIQQIAARLNWPLIRVNFDSEITRMDLIGRDVLKKDESGVTVSEFVDGVLPTAIAGPYILLCDEVDFVRADVAYVFQRALEDEGILISEDGGRVVHPHKWSRIIATANTKGQGDDFGLYQGARPQSMAFLDRFTVWVTCEYMDDKAERKLIKARVPDISKERLDQIIKYAQEHRQSFTEVKIMQPLSPRSLITLAESLVFYDKACATLDEANQKGYRPFSKAARQTLLNKANKTDGAVMTGIINRVSGE